MPRVRLGLCLAFKATIQVQTWRCFGTPVTTSRRLQSSPSVPLSSTSSPCVSLPYLTDTFIVVQCHGQWCQLAGGHLLKLTELRSPGATLPMGALPQSDSCLPFTVHVVIFDYDAELWMTKFENSESSQIVQRASIYRTGRRYYRYSVNPSRHF